MGIRPVVNSKGTILERLEEEMAKVFIIMNERLQGKGIKNSEEVVEKFKETTLGNGGIMFSMDVEKMFTSIKREAVKKEIMRLADSREIIRGWKKEEILENLNFIGITPTG